jgi:hypothetical protein
MITHFQYLRHVALSFLGVATLIAALILMFYTTASDALVSPHLPFGYWDNILIEGVVKTIYANPLYMKKNCQTPITADVDSDFSEIPCLDIENAGQCKLDPCLSEGCLTVLQRITMLQASLGPGPTFTKEVKVPLLILHFVPMLRACYSTTPRRSVAGLRQTRAT